MAPSPSAEEEDSDGVEDDSLDEDLQALKRACLLAGRDPSHAPDLSVGEASDSEDDLDLLRSIQQRFPLPLIARPSQSVRSMDSEEEDDFETLRAIEKRFKQYEKGSDAIKNATPDDKISYNLSEGGTGETLCIKHTEPVNLQQSDDRSDGSPLPATETSRFPFSAQKFVDALKINRSSQKFIRAKLIEIEAKIERIKELKKRTKCLMDLQCLPRRRMGRILCQRKDPRVRLISLPKQRALSKIILRRPLPLGYGPTENRHVSTFRNVLARFPHFSSKPKWSKAEKENLAKGIKQQYQERAFLASMEISDDPGGGLENPIDYFRNKLGVSADDIRFFLRMVDWDRLASMYLPGRSGAECESRWLNHEDPVINHCPWTTQEEKKLLRIIQTKGIYNWIDISISLATHRTPFQCLVRYQRSLNPCILRKEWTEDEDSRLRAAVEVFGEDNWQLIASYLEGRTGPQCSNRWRNCLHPSRRKVGRWSVDEDKRLKVAVILFGAKNWNKITQFVPGRTQVQCRERWVNCLDPALKLEEWTQEEDTKLREAIATFGYSWSKVASSVPPRTDNQCMRRWKALFPDEVFLRQAAWRVQKAVLVTNFVDRELERPSIGPSDFCISSTSDVLPITNTPKRKRESQKRENLVDSSQSNVSKRVSSRKRKTKKETSMNIADGIHQIEIHGQEIVSREIEKSLDQVTESEGIKRKRRRRSGTACLESAPLLLDAPIKCSTRGRNVVKRPNKAGSDAPKRVTSRKGRTKKDVDDGSRQIENHDQEMVSREGEKSLDLVTESEGIERSVTACLELAPLSLLMMLR
ncbi:myb domain protein 4r1 isoform X2 [Wolffia australiana]